MSDTNTNPNIITFADLGLSADALDAAAAAGFEAPTPIQERAIPPLLADEDQVAQT